MGNLISRPPHIAMLNQGLGSGCFDLSWQNVDGTVFAGHIHVAPAGSPGPSVVPLFGGE